MRRNGSNCQGPNQGNTACRHCALTTPDRFRVERGSTIWRSRAGCVELPQGAVARLRDLAAIPLVVSRGGEA
jgi:hypothetical protein